MNDHGPQLARTGFCPRFHQAVELVGRRWTGVIVRLLLGGPQRFSELAAAIPGVTDRMLSERLKELEAEGLVHRSVLPQQPVRVEYELTEKGAALAPIVGAVADWAERWLPLPAEAAPPTLADDVPAPSRGSRGP
ncbi:MAG TPA: helix-turn-helix domain-containing protein [Dehalococcoidia bacterium]|nr:helix-turn-helix domain-containing protein [Dehalococcoidia bacterium]